MINIQRSPLIFFIVGCHNVSMTHLLWLNLSPSIKWQSPIKRFTFLFIRMQTVCCALRFPIHLCVGCFPINWSSVHTHGNTTQHTNRNCSPKLGLWLLAILLLLVFVVARENVDGIFLICFFFSLCCWCWHHIGVVWIWPAASFYHFIAESDTFNLDTDSLSKHEYIN